MTHPKHNPSASTRLPGRIRVVRNILPPIIVLVVILVEHVIGKLNSTADERMSHLLFYGIVGPLVTFFSIEWIAQGARAREEAQLELRKLYLELIESHSRIKAVQQLISEVAESPDMEAISVVAARGALRATGATHAEISLKDGIQSFARGETLLAAPSADLHKLTLDIPSGGSLSLYFEGSPSQETLALSQSLAAEIGNGVEAARSRTLDLMTLYNVDQGIRAERNMRRLLALITSNMASRLSVDARAAYLTDQDCVLRLEYSDSGDLIGGLPAPAFAIRVAEAGVPLLASKEEASSVFTHASSALGLPMQDDSGLIGVIVLGDQKPEAFLEAPVALLAFMAGQASLAVRNARAYLYSEELAISDERARIAREIHDGVAQSLAFAALKLDIITRQIYVAPAKAEAEIKIASEILREQIREVRRSIFALRPIDLERYGLLETVRRYVADFGEQNTVRTQLEISGDTHLSPSDEAIVFRILQESLNNVAKHSQAKEVSISIHGEATVLLRVKDDGIGFDPEHVSGRVSTAGGLGLIQMRERVESRGGNYSVTSSVGIGTTVEAELPQA